MAWGLGYFGMPHILLRFMAIEDDKKLSLSRRVASIWVVISMAVSVLIGIVGLAVSKTGAIPVLEGNSSETIIVQISHLLSTRGFIFALIAGIVLSGILASTMSTSDSQLLAASSSVSNDIINGVFHVEADQKQLLKISRISLLIIAVIGVVLAWNPDSSVFRIVSFAWAGFGASFGPVMLLALFWKKSNKWGALFGMITGGAMVFIWKFIIAPMGGVLAIYELLPAFVLALIVNVIVSLVTGGAEEAVQKEYESI
jgi:sodium/proline symporter